MASDQVRYPRDILRAPPLTQVALSPNPKAQIRFSNTHLFRGWYASLLVNINEAKVEVAKGHITGLSFQRMVKQRIDRCVYMHACLRMFHSFIHAARHGRGLATSSQFSAYTKENNAFVGIGRYSHPCCNGQSAM